MLHSINNSSTNGSGNAGEVCNKEKLEIAYSKNILTAYSNLSALHFLQREMLERVAEIVYIFIPFFVESNRYIQKTTDVNFIMSHNLKSILSFSGTEFKINYNKLLISHGTLAGGFLARTKAAHDSILFSWLKNSHNRRGQKNDKVILVVFCEALNKCVYSIGSAKRSDTAVILEVPQFSGYEVQTWLSFLSDDGKLIATSVYTGALTIP